MKSTQATVNTTASILVDGREGSNAYPMSATIKNGGATTMFLGGADVTNSNGFALTEGQAVDVDLIGDILYGVTASGSTTAQILRVGL